MVKTKQFNTVYDGGYTQFQQLPTVFYITRNIEKPLRSIFPS